MKIRQAYKIVNRVSRTKRFTLGRLKSDTYFKAQNLVRRRERRWWARHREVWSRLEESATLITVQMPQDQSSPPLSA